MRISKERWEAAQGAERHHQEAKAGRIAGYHPEMAAHRMHEVAALESSLRPFLCLRPETRVLEVGSGPLGAIFFLSDGRRTGVDPLASFYRKRFADFQLRADVQTLDCMGEELPFEEDSFDLVLCHNVLDHTRDPKQVLQEIHRVSSPGAHLSLKVHTHAQPSRLLSTVNERFFGRGPMLANVFRPHPFFFSQRQVERLLAETGAEILDAQTKGHWRWDDTLTRPSARWLKSHVWWLLSRVRTFAVVARLP